MYGLSGRFTDEQVIITSITVEFRLNVSVTSVPKKLTTGGVRNTEGDLWKRMSVLLTLT